MGHQSNVVPDFPILDPHAEATENQETYCGRRGLGRFRSKLKKKKKVLKIIDHKRTEMNVFNKDFAMVEEKI